MDMRFDTWKKGRELALLGYIKKIVMIETGLTYKQVRRLYNELEREGVCFNVKSQAMRSGSAIITNQKTKVDASVLMQLYLGMAKSSAHERVDIEALNCAYEMYNSICQYELRDLGTNLDITDAWCLAKELSDKKAMIEYCDSCSVNYFTSINERTPINCPFCKNAAGALKSSENCLWSTGQWKKHFHKA